PFCYAEIGVANRVRVLRDCRADRLAEFASVDWERALAWLTQTTGRELAAEQRAAVLVALSQRVSVLTGGPGTGKSTSVRSVVELALDPRLVVVASPDPTSGAAAMRVL